ncbi:MAG: hypothetical protein ACJAS6_000842 [Rickettsiales bacterium]|jgi:hypothetical protein
MIGVIHDCDFFTIYAWAPKVVIGLPTHFEKEPIMSILIMSILDQD